jgi:signal transduction histidine kinase
VIDYAGGVVFGFSVFAGLHSAITVSGGRVIGLIFAIGVAVAVGRRRRHPLLSLGLLLSGSLLVVFVTGDGNAAANLFLPAAYVLYFIVATLDSRRDVGRALAFALIAVVLDLLVLMASGSNRHGGLSAGADLIPVVLCMVIAWSVGYIVKQRRRYAVGLQVEAASKAVAEERLRIARELHDVVAHSMSVIAVQAGYGQYVIDSHPADASAALGAIQTTSREALDEMRRMLGALRAADAPSPAAQDAAADIAPPTADPASAAPLFPAPGLVDLDRLVTRTASAGVEASVARTGTVRDLPASIDMSAYRIIQEALTNVVKHAQASRCDVLIDYGDEELRIEVTDSGAGIPALAGVVPAQAVASTTQVAGPGWGGSGHGIIGMRERVSLLGGSFSAGPLAGYGFQVTARIPLPHGAA